MERAGEKGDFKLQKSPKLIPDRFQLLFQYRQFFEQTCPSVVSNLAGCRKTAAVANRAGPE